MIQQIHGNNVYLQMNEILGDDYEKKMAVVGVMKQFAEDRDIDILARALAVILKSQHQLRIIRQIRYLWVLYRSPGSYTGHQIHVQVRGHQV